MKGGLSSASTVSFDGCLERCESVVGHALAADPWVTVSLRAVAVGAAHGDQAELVGEPLVVAALGVAMDDLPGLDAPEAGCDKRS